MNKKNTRGALSGWTTVVQRELLSAARRPQTYRGRLGAAALALGMALFAGLASGRMTVRSSFGHDLFQVLSGMGLMLGLLAGGLLSADCLSREKREGTLNLLFLTPLQPLEVVLGKLAGCLVNAALALLAALPVLTICFLFGGVTAQEYLRVALVLACALALALAAGMFSSACLRSRRAALGLTLFLIFGFTLGWYVVMILFGDFRIQGGILFHLRIWSLVHTLVMAYQQNYPSAPAVFWAGCGMAVLAAALMLALAGVAARGFRREDPTAAGWSWWQMRQNPGPEGQAPKHGRRWAAWRWRGPNRRREIWRRRLLQRNPVYWLQMRDRWKPWLVVLFAAGISLTLIVLWRVTGYWENGLVIAAGLVWATGMKLWCAWSSGRLFARPQREEILAVLLGTPLPLLDIMKGQAMAVWRQFVIPFVVFGMILIGIYWGENHKLRPLEAAWLGSWLLAGMVDLWAMAWVAMAETLASGKLNNGVATAYARVMLVPGLFLLIVAVVSEQHGPDWALPLCLAISVVMSLAAVISARATAHFFEKRRGWETRPRWGMFSRALAFLRG